MARPLLLVSVLLASLFATSVTSSPSATAAPAEEPRASVAEALAAHLNAAGIPADTDWTPDADAAGLTPPESTLPEESWTPPEASRAVATPEGSASRAPAGTVIGAPGLGSLPSFSFHDIPLSDDTVLQVNLGNGNLLVTAADESIAGAGIGLRSDRFYNGLSPLEGDFGGGWTSSLSAQYVGLKGAPAAGTPTNQEFHGPTGLRVMFTWDGAKYVPAAGFKATLTVAAAVPASYLDPYYMLTYTSTGEQQQFTKYGYRLSDKDRNGVGLTYSYPTDEFRPVITDAAGRQITTTLAAGSTTQWGSVQDSAGRQSVYERNSAGMLTKVTQPDGGINSYTYDSTGRLKTMVLGASASDPTVTFGYDTSHRVTSITQTTKADGTVGANIVTSFAYTAGQTVVTDPRAGASTFALDSAGRVTTATDQLGRKRATTWTANGDVATTTDAFAAPATAGNTTTLAYDALGNQTGATLPTGAGASAVYALGTGCATAGAGNPYLAKCTTDAAGNKKALSYDTAGNLTQVSDTTAGGSGSTPQRFSYDTATRALCGGFAGQVCTSTDGNNNVTRYTYDTAGNLTTVTPPAPLGPTTYTYDSLGRALTVTDGMSNTTTYIYDAADRIVTTSSDSGEYFDLYYTLLGAVYASCDSNVACDLHSINAQGLTTRTQHYGLTSAGDFLTAYVYDLVGNMTRTDALSGSTQYSYDAANQLIRLQQPGGTCPTSGAPAASSGCVVFAYDSNGAEKTRTLPGGATVTTIRDVSGRPTRITAKDSAAATVVDIGYSYTAAGLTGPSADRTTIQSRTSYREQGITAGAATAYAYDSLNRVVSAIEKSGTTTTASWAYGYDTAGNRTTQTRAGSTGAVAGTLGYSYNAANQLASTTGDTTTWTYDAAGNQTRNGLTGVTASYGDRGETTAMGATAFEYYGPGNSVRTDAGGRDFTSTALGLDTQTASATLGYSYTSTGVAIGYKGTANHYYIADSLGSVVGMFSATGSYEGGYSYSPYGEARSTGTAAAVTTNTQRYIGGYQESANLYKLGARYYDATTGRFTQMDPSGQESHPYAYAACNPVNAKDPSGLAACSPGAAEAANVLGNITLVAGAVALVAGYIAATAAAPVTGGLSVAGMLAWSGTAVGFIAGGPAALISNLC